MKIPQTDDFGFKAVEKPMHVHDLHATMLYLLGFDHHKLNYRFQGLEQKLTSVKPARVRLLRVRERDSLACFAARTELAA